MEAGDGGLTFEPDADYYAQLVRLQSLITKKQKKKKEKVSKGVMRGAKDEGWGEI